MVRSAKTTCLTRFVRFACASHVSGVFRTSVRALRVPHVLQGSPVPCRQFDVLHTSFTCITRLARVTSAPHMFDVSHTSAPCILRASPLPRVRLCFVALFALAHVLPVGGVLCTCLSRVGHLLACAAVHVCRCVLHASVWLCLHASVWLCTAHLCVAVHCTPLRGCALHTAVWLCNIPSVWLCAARLRVAVHCPPPRG